MMLSYKENIKFSILIPAYKAKYLKECIMSILAQTYKNFEVIIVNDHSPEDLTSIVNSFNDERIKYYINSVNCGAIDVVDNWNITLSYATGDYAICMGDDDMLVESCLRIYKKCIDLHPDTDIFHIKTQLIDEYSEVFETLEDRPTFESAYDILLGRWKGRKQFIGDFLFKINILNQNGGFIKIPMGLCSDDLTAVYQARKKGIININEVGFLYRESRLTISRNGQYKILLKALDQIEFYIDNIVSWDGDCVSNKLKVLELTNICPLYFKRMRYSIIAHEFAISPFKIIEIFKKKNYYKLSLLLILKAFLSGCYNKFLKFK